MPYQKQEPQTFRQFRIIKRLYAFEELQGSFILIIQKSPTLKKYDNLTCFYFKNIFYDKLRLV